MGRDNLTAVVGANKITMFSVTVDRMVTVMLTGGVVLIVVASIPFPVNLMDNTKVVLLAVRIVRML